MYKVLWQSNQVLGGKFLIIYVLEIKRTISMEMLIIMIIQSVNILLKNKFKFLIFW